MAIQKKLRWRGKNILQFAKKKIERNMGPVTQFLRNEVVKSIKKSQPLKRQPSGRRIGLSPSQPGHPPKMVEGDLVKSIIAEVEVTKTKIIGRYGSTQGKKAKALEFGTSRMKPRPFLRPPLFKNKKKIVRMLTK